jgi:hypothetical protein
MPFVEMVSTMLVRAVRDAVVRADAALNTASGDLVECRPVTATAAATTATTTTRELTQIHRCGRARGAGGVSRSVSGTDAADGIALPGIHIPEAGAAGIGGRADSPNPGRSGGCGVSSSTGTPIG